MIKVKKLEYSIDNEKILENISVTVKEKKFVGIIGANGCGKSTLLKNIYRFLKYKNGEIIIDSIELSDYKSKALAKKMAVLAQKQNMNFDFTVEEIIEMGRYAHHDSLFTSEKKEIIKEALQSVGLEQMKDRSFLTLSGGEMQRVLIARALAQNSDILILDEPTNHLDLNAIEWLEKILKDYKKAFILISHDVYFLDNVVNRIFEIEGKTLKTYNGNYTDFTIQKEAYLSGAVKAFDKEQDKLRKMEEFIRRYKAGVKSKQARGREKILNRMDKMENPVITTKKIKLKFETDTTSVDLVLRIKDLAKSFDGKEIFSNLNLDIYRGDRVGVIGKNGVGKSTLLKIINGMEKQSKGDFKIGERVKIGYYDQNHQGLDPKKTVLEELMYHFVLSEEEARNICGGFLFTEDDVYKEISSLSGGEKARVAFMKLMLEKPNFLILDEPTNHLDIYSREILSESLEDYTGTILVVSHDRNFLDCVVNNIYEVKKDGAELFKGDYNSYLNQREEVKEKDVKASLNFEEQKKNKNRISSLEKKIIKAESDVEKLEEKKSAKEEEYNEAGIENNVDKLMEIQKELEELDMEILSLMEEWEELENELKTLKNTF